ncbi:MAG: pyridoxal phosphate-dependent aminotransferase [Chitinophagaceae bacterium]|nr:pyridoxal phosphate-dependent aminotransferase [Oligoflexus sp.]
MFPSFRDVPNTGVIYVMSKAQKQGFVYGSDDWANLGQGAPETGLLYPGEKRLTSIVIDPSCSEYSPVAGARALRQAVADLYNVRYRRGMASQYTYENVAISSGGRSGLARVAASLGTVHLGHYLPDYTAYEELFDAFKGFVPIPILLEEADGFRATADQLKHEIVSRGLGAVLLSNPHNPTGQVIYGPELERYVGIGRQYRCSLIFDEFYSHYLYDEVQAAHRSLSAARYVEDVDRDTVIVLDGLTKNWRYPGLRIAWTLGPKEIIKRIASAGSFLDGGAAHPIQKAVIPLLDPGFADEQALSIQKSFVEKRNYMIAALDVLGLQLPHRPKAGFYCFVSLKTLKPELQDGIEFFEAALAHKVITVPGKFFDVNPGNRRRHLPSRLSQYARFSYGPSKVELERGMSRLQELLR